ncbi:anhydro-N-acetylmuramic acid kinase [soil metagenome]
MVLNERLANLTGRPRRLVAGLMSGTSLDGVAVAVAYIEGTGPDLSLECVAYQHQAFDPTLRSALLKAADNGSVAASEVSQLNVVLAQVFAEAVQATLADADIAMSELDLIGCHGQTLQHVPDDVPCAGRPAVRSTLQLGDGATLATLTGTPVVSNYRSTDMALGGQGAPLVPYFDFVALSSKSESRLALNLGGIANITVLPAGGSADQVRAFDTGPANMVIDALAQLLFETPFDRDGLLAARGVPDLDLVGRLLREPFFHRTPPKSTGRELFGGAFVERLIAEGPLNPNDLLATATALTARSIHLGYASFIEAQTPIDVVVASGGGVHNREIMRHLRMAFDPIPAVTTAEYGIDPDAKEALCFAVLAHEWVNGTPTSLPFVTGAARAAVLGELALP